jgi:hypothetical protein
VLRQRLDIFHRDLPYESRRLATTRANSAYNRFNVKQGSDGGMTLVAKSLAIYQPLNRHIHYVSICCTTDLLAGGT